MEKGIEAFKAFCDKQMANSDFSPETIKSRRNSVLKVLENQPDYLKKDLSRIDIEKMANEFAEKHRGSFKDPSTIYTYQKRFKLGLQSFLDAVEKNQEINSKQNNSSAYSEEHSQPDVEIHIRLGKGTEFKFSRDLSRAEAERLRKIIDVYTLKN